GARTGLDPPARQEAKALERRIEAFLPLRVLLDRGQRAGDSPPRRFDAAFAFEAVLRLPDVTGNFGHESHGARPILEVSARETDYNRHMASGTIRRVLIAVRPHERGLPLAAVHARYLAQRLDAELALVACIYDSTVAYRLARGAPHAAE